MLTIAEKTSEGTIYRAAKSYPVPNIDILSLLFDSDYCLAKPDTKIHLSAANPSQHYVTVSRARALTEATTFALRKYFNIGGNGPNQDIVSVISTGHYLLPVLAYGVIGSNGVFSAASAASTAGELSKQLQGAESKILCCSQAVKDVATKAAEEAGWGKNGGGRAGSGELGPNLIDENQRLGWNKITDIETLKNRLVFLIYSSGTTGLPKGVQLSQHNVVAETTIPGDMLREWRSSPEGSEFEYRTVAHLPVAHIAGIQGYLISPFYNGGEVYWMPRFDFPKFLEYSEKYRVTTMFTVPPIYLLIAKMPQVTTQFKTMRFAVGGAAPLGKELQEAASAKLGGDDCFISQTWGLSETCGSTTFMPHGVPHDKTGSVSPLMPNMQARIIDDNGKDVEVGQPGEIVVKGPVVCKGYYKNEAANKEAFDGEWFFTGDIAVFRNGLLYIVDRKKELIKYKGIQVAPAELEALLIDHADILDAAVIGVETEDGTNEVPRAYVVADQKKISAEQIMEYVKKNVASHKQLRGGVIFLDAIPKSPSGKILRKDLRVLAKREKGAKL
ncbi:4-coumarate-CoA ligase-like protein [Periconia macrospinosa]|uniref:4-coumarate-CoA ligase-like protein n=1 Tax=Periconia macrospinosa TaxID=97972 RepID=A0A2V1ED05_9PLEO|nr:4-coumarate-CoA ligase-like protein [Periconia macrospinosa]